MYSIIKIWWMGDQQVAPLNQCTKKNNNSKKPETKETLCTIWKIWDSVYLCGILFTSRIQDFNIIDKHIFCILILFFLLWGEQFCTATLKLVFTKLVTLTFYLEQILGEQKIKQTLANLYFPNLCMLFPFLFDLKREEARAGGSETLFKKGKVVDVIYPS